MGRAVWVVGVLCVAGGLALLLWRFVGEAPAPAPQREPVPPAQPAPEPSPPIAATVPTPREPEPPEVLPPLDGSDPIAREAGRTLSHDATFETWLKETDLVRRFVAGVDNVADGRSPSSHVAFLAPQEPFEAEGEPDAGFATDETWRRWDPVVDVVVSLDAAACARAFDRIEPLLDEAYAELGHPGGGFRRRLEQAIAELLAAPTVVGRPMLVQPVYSWHYADPELESLSSAQKQLLRLGPRNAARVQQKLREIAVALGARPSALPAPRTLRAQAADAS